MLVAAVDWSGRAGGAHRYIWTAVAARGRLRLEGNRDREGVGDLLIELAMAEPRLAVGLDFGFSLPLWFLEREGLENGMSVPEELAERWLANCPPPFWGRRGRGRGQEVQLRRTEMEVSPRPKPVFQIGGAGSVGTASLRGLPVLRRLRREGFSIWPFDPPRLPVVVEVFPRLLTGPVVKSRRPAREAYLRLRGLPPEAAASEDVFDAAVSALVMARQGDAFGALPVECGRVFEREGRIWIPDRRAGTAAQALAR